MTINTFHRATPTYQPPTTPTTTMTSPDPSPIPMQRRHSDQYPQNVAPEGCLPTIVYRVHRAGAQTLYSPETGFTSKNQSTLVTTSADQKRFGLAHLNWQTNIQSPFIAVYGNHLQAETVAKHFATKYNEDTYLMTVNTTHLGRGPVFQAAHILQQGEEAVAAVGMAGQGRVPPGQADWLHHGEWLIMYRIPPEAVLDYVKVNNTPVQSRFGPRRFSE